MCGADSKVPLKKIKIEGAELSVCNNCAKYGTEVPVSGRSSPVSPVRNSPGAGYSAKSPLPYKSKDVFDRMEGDIVEDYAERIRNARMQLGLSQKDLALEMMEKELLVKKIEKGDLIPEEDVRKKLEKALSIQLVENTSSITEEFHQSKMATTMGDVIKIKKSKK